MIRTVTTNLSKNCLASSPTVTRDGHEWIQRAGYLWGTYKTYRSYLGFGSPESVIAYAARHNLRRIKHGKYTLLCKDQVDSVTGATSEDRAA